MTVSQKAINAFVHTKAKWLLHMQIAHDYEYELFAFSINVLQKFSENKIYSDTRTDIWNPNPNPI